MAAHTYSGREGKLRIYDGDTPPHFLEIPFVEVNLVAPSARARSNDPIVVTVGGYVHAPVSADYDSGFYEGQPISFSCWIENRHYRQIRNALCNMDMNSTWTVGAHTWVTTKGRGSIIKADGNYFATQAFFDTKKVAVDVQAAWTDRLSGSVVAMRYDESYFPPQTITQNESAEYVQLQVQGIVYGNIQATGGFSAGTESVDYDG
jgi:hypothetical protein